MVLPIALPLMDSLSLLLKLGRTLRGKVSRISTLEALDMSMHLLLILCLAHHLGILNKYWIPPLLVFFFFIIKSSPSSWLILICSWVSSLSYLVALVEALLVASPIA